MRFKRFKYLAGPEFEDRKSCLPLFGRTSCIVIPIIVRLHKSLRAWGTPLRTVSPVIDNLVLAGLAPRQHTDNINALSEN